MLAATKVKMSHIEEKKQTGAHTIFPPQNVSRALEVSRCSHAKQRQKNVQKSVLHVQSFFGGGQLDLSVFLIVLVVFAV